MKKEYAALGDNEKTERKITREYIENRIKEHAKNIKQEQDFKRYYENLLVQHGYK